MNGPMQIPSLRYRRVYMLNNSMCNWNFILILGEKCYCNVSRIPGVHWSPSPGLCPLERMVMIWVRGQHSERHSCSSKTVSLVHFRSTSLKVVNRLGAVECQLRYAASKNMTARSSGVGDNSKVFCAGCYCLHTSGPAAVCENLCA